MENRNILKCAKCAKVYQQKRSYESHVAICGINKRFQCENCDCAYSALFSLERHVREKHEPPTKKPLVECEKCGKCFDSPVSLKEHAISHGKQCGECGKVFSSAYNLRRHVVVLHKNVSFLLLFCFSFQFTKVSSHSQLTKDTPIIPAQRLPIDHVSLSFLLFTFKLYFCHMPHSKL